MIGDYFQPLQLPKKYKSIYDKREDCLTKEKILNVSFMKEFRNAINIFIFLRVFALANSEAVGGFLYYFFPQKSDRSESL
ncbi:hypothetical protein CRV08_10670 [Halarcobacter ebronensis]|uniref:Uncharacterized protein n=1 Tax=Halarcobacter ebronensis TaxID=1462615 RepID=A0A4Q0YBH3_9BACT|nr:hypothetical protein [Halarcobacter ebronensis]RXJ67383.1 hypothetical protein CRV08_10670 [Halarcobacter ebronensis]